MYLDTVLKQDESSTPYCYERRECPATMEQAVAYLAREENHAAHAVSKVAFNGNHEHDHIRHPEDQEQQRHPDMKEQGWSGIRSLIHLR